MHADCDFCQVVAGGNDTTINKTYSRFTIFFSGYSLESNRHFHTHLLQAKGTKSTSFLVRNEVDLEPLACEDVPHDSCFVFAVNKCTDPEGAGGLNPLWSNISL